jgi:hypothetical protein
MSSLSVSEKDMLIETEQYKSSPITFIQVDNACNKTHPCQHDVRIHYANGFRALEIWDANRIVRELNDTLIKTGQYKHFAHADPNREIDMDRPRRDKRGRVLLIKGLSRM